MTSKVIYSAWYHIQHYTLQAFEQFGALYMHSSHMDKYPARPGFEPAAGTSMVQASAHTYEPIGLANKRRSTIKN